MKRNKRGALPDYTKPQILVKHIPISLFSSHISGANDTELLAQCYGYSASCGGCSIGCICNFFCGQNCLPGSIVISTMHGDVRIKDIRESDFVWSMDKKGKKILVPIKYISHIRTNPYHEIAHVTLCDGRSHSASKNHPTINGYIAELKCGEYYDGAKIESVQTTPYLHKTTYDLLPDSDTGFYWANGILMGSALKNVYSEAIHTIHQTK